MKFSIIIPVYNVEKYIKKCLESIMSQTYNNYEVIIINDGSPDNSEKIIKDYIKDKENFHYYKKENGGLSDARNYGLQYITGEYLIFIDSDDYIENKLLEKLHKKIEEQSYDIIRYELKEVNEDYEIIDIPQRLNIKNTNKYNILKSIFKSKYIEPAWLYAYKTSFWKKNKFKYAKGKIHEDYGLTPIIFSKAKNIGYIDYIGYNYVQRENSIMNQVNYEKIIKRVNDFKEHFLEHKKVIKNNCKENKLILSFSALAMLYKVRELKEKERKEYIHFLKQERVIKKIYPLNIKMYLQKIYLWLFLEKYIKKLNTNFYNNGE